MKPITVTHLSKRKVCQLLNVERNRNNGGKQKNPFHEGDHMVPSDQGSKDAKIGGKEQTIANHQQDADGLRLGDAIAMGTNGVHN